MDRAKYHFSWLAWAIKKEKQYTACRKVLLSGSCIHVCGSMTWCTLYMQIQIIRKHPHIRFSLAPYAGDANEVAMRMSKGARFKVGQDERPISKTARKSIAVFTASTPQLIWGDGSTTLTAWGYVTYIGHFCKWMVFWNQQKWPYLLKSTVFK